MEQYVFVLVHMAEALQCMYQRCRAMLSQETYEDGSSYEGQLADGRRHGYGTWTSTAEQYSGQWVYPSCNDVMRGPLKNVFITLNGRAGVRKCAIHFSDIRALFIGLAVCC